ncbi:MAG: ATP-dependent endonuclease [Dongiaceae bacterium]
MAVSKQVRLLQNKWQANTGWPKRLEWMELHGLRGWTGQRIDFRFPIMAICGENGSGKSTIIQSAAACYAAPPNRKGFFASDFFPDTAWEKVENAQIRVSIREGTSSTTSSVRKPGERWRGNPTRRERAVEYIDLSRVQPVSARVGFTKLSKSTVAETEFTAFEQSQLDRLSEIMGRRYSAAKMALTDVDKKRRVPVVTLADSPASGFHLGAGELTMAEFLKTDPPMHSLVLIDEVETSLHPRAQRRLLRDLADLCRVRELQIILTTHSPYILGELPPEARGYILKESGRREVVLGVSPEFAMTKMDDEVHPECDVFVEDDRAEKMLREILVAHAPDIVSRMQLVPYGAASVGQALGQMAANNRFPRPSVVFLDGDQAPQVGCQLLPGTDAPERVVFESLQKIAWEGIAARTGRSYSDIVDACTRAIASNSHHEWVGLASHKLLLGGDVLWQAMCAEWATKCLLEHEARLITDVIRATLPT